MHSGGPVIGERSEVSALRTKNDFLNMRTRMKKIRDEILNNRGNIVGTHHSMFKLVASGIGPNVRGRCPHEQIVHLNAMVAHFITK
jgi:hypothetical protein